MFLTRWEKVQRKNTFSNNFKPFSPVQDAVSCIFRFTHVTSRLSPCLS